MKRLCSLGVLFDLLEVVVVIFALLSVVIQGHEISMVSNRLEGKYYLHVTGRLFTRPAARHRRRSGRNFPRARLQVVSPPDRYRIVAVE
jgi:hypothetical protein